MERVQLRTVEQNVDVYMPRVAEEIVEVVQIILYECAWERHVEQIVDVSMPENEEQLVEKEVFAEIVSHECVECISEHINEQVIDVPALPLSQNRAEMITRRAKSAAVGRSALLDGSEHARSACREQIRASLATSEGRG